MASWEPIDISQFDRDDIEDVYDKWDDDLTSDIEIRYKKLRQFNITLNGSHDEDLINVTTSKKDKLKRDTIELIANQIYDKLTISFNNNRKRFGIQKGIPIAEPIKDYYNFKLADDGELTYVYKRTVIDLGNVNEGLKTPWEIRKLGVVKLRSMGFINITDEDTNPYRKKYKKARERIRKLDENLEDQKR